MEPTSKRASMEKETTKQHSTAQHCHCHCLLHSTVQHSTVQHCTHLHELDLSGRAHRSHKGPRVLQRPDAAAAAAAVGAQPAQAGGDGHRPHVRQHAGQQQGQGAADPGQVLSWRHGLRQQAGCRQAPLERHTAAQLCKLPLLLPIGLVGCGCGRGSASSSWCCWCCTSCCDSGSAGRPRVPLRDPRRALQLRGHHSCGKALAQGQAGGLEGSHQALPAAARKPTGRKL
jgi:hypothetical protein